MTDPNTAPPVSPDAAKKVYRWDDPALDDLADGESFTIDVGTGPTLLLQPYLEAVFKTANGNKVTLETREKHATVLIETPRETFMEYKFAASELEAVIQLWVLLYGYPPELRPKATAEAEAGRPQESSPAS